MVKNVQNVFYNNFHCLNFLYVISKRNRMKILSLTDAKCSNLCFSSESVAWAAKFSSCMGNRGVLISKNQVRRVRREQQGIDSCGSHSTNIPKNILKHIYISNRFINTWINQIIYLLNISICIFVYVYLHQAEDNPLIFLYE